MKLINSQDGSRFLLVDELSIRFDKVETMGEDNARIIKLFLKGNPVSVLSGKLSAAFSAMWAGVTGAAL